jgi:two-component system chemotaxis family response regulator WspR
MSEAQPPAVASVVLLVDDQVIIGEAVRRMLVGEADIQFHHCADASVALATAHRVNPTVILQDLVMPNASGFALLAQYRGDALTRDIPVMVLSTKEDPVVKSDAFTAGASDYLVKLPDRVELIARIRLQSRARVNQLQRDEAHRALVSVNQQLEEATERLRVEATHDTLSGLMNRRAFFDNMQRELSRSKRKSEPVALIMGDIDHFKGINDSRGHMAGDAVIREVARRLRNTVRTSDLVGRYGGEEFVILAVDCPAEAASKLAERMRRSVAATPIPFADNGITATISLGVAAALNGYDGDELLRTGDEALYRAKRAGRDRVELAVLSA